MSDLDGFSVSGDYQFPLNTHFNQGESDSFGFDPPAADSAYPKMEPTYSPQDHVDPLHVSPWQSFDASSRGVISQKRSASPINSQSIELNKLITQNLPNGSSALSRYGQMTPPRSNSAASDEASNTDSLTSPKTTNERRKRTSKAVIKEEASETSKPTSTRKRKSTRKLSVVSEEQDDKRRQSLEKNRLAAAKCRVNKKEKTEQLQRDSHDKAVHNAFLKEQVMRMKEEVQQMNALLLAHANCDGCKSPENIQKHLNNLGNEFFAHHMPGMNFGDFSQMNMSDMPSMSQDMQNDFFSSHNSDAPPMLNPPLPDFDRTAEFDVHTPMQTD